MEELCSQSMDANIVFLVAKALPIEEQKNLLKKLKEELQPKNTHKNQNSLSEQEAIFYLLENVFKSK